MDQNRLIEMNMVQRANEGNALRQKFPQLYGALGGFLGTAPDEFEGSVFDPLTEQVRQGAEFGYLPGLLSEVLPGKAASVNALKGLADGGALLMMVADPRKKNAFKGLLGGNREPVSVGTVTEWQKKGIVDSGRYSPPLNNELHADIGTANHLQKRKNENFSGDDLWDVVTNAMRNDAKVSAPDFDKNRVYPSLVSKGSKDKLTGKTYDATLPVAVEDGKMVIKTIVPDGLPARKKKTTWP